MLVHPVFVMCSTHSFVEENVLVHQKMRGSCIRSNLRAISSNKTKIIKTSKRLVKTCFEDFVWQLDFDINLVSNVCSHMLVLDKTCE